MRIAFCTTCMNRRWQLDETLPVNLRALRGTTAFLALVDFNSGDNLAATVDRKFRDDLRDGTLLYFRTEQPTSFHASVAKNTAHRLGLRRAADVLFNLDADNFISADVITAVVARFTRDPNTLLHGWSRSWPDGSFGRIGMSATNWHRVGGYDESFEPMGFQDVDLLMRARAAGLKYHLSSDGFPTPVPNAMEDKLAAVHVSPTLRTDDAVRTYKNMGDNNLLHSLTRPIFLDPSEQRRFRGRLNFGDEVLL
jgi:hypothetical protein